ncbi:MAG: phosphatidylethanolamine/phosphatidyl-N-methylethanolamine N-methyltransferase [Alphaproteobacteria bacterium]|jgi:phosphatidylethanolamine/phosphatidyl-N-methylethanolamine N-methyltransferase|nr:phosphatidylethanolamine/phosphatidyl-N-methylethanolamine N-methyltransferase [Alphaproteobacteria bacterium]MEA2988004.1 phosphatidylethanolamine/phosphatidyl-N-methylethanolamine N-methyltransferase [Alphaproteobacteria bacterium]
MPLQALQVLEKKIERQIRLFGLKRGVLERKIEKKIETQKKKIGQKFENHKRKIEIHFRRFEEKNRARIDDEVRFFRSWIEKPLAIGAVTPSGKALARTMAAFVDPALPGPIIELGPGTGPVTEALVAQGIDPARLVLVEFDPTFCRLLRQRYPTATVVQGDAYGLRRLLDSLLIEPAAAVVSGLPLFTKPLKTRLQLLFEAFGLMTPGAPFIQFTYAAISPIPRALDRVKSEVSERIWTNIPPARVWVYRKH